VRTVAADTARAEIGFDRGIRLGANPIGSIDFAAVFARLPSYRGWVLQ